MLFKIQPDDDDDSDDDEDDEQDDVPSIVLWYNIH